MRNHAAVSSWIACASVLWACACADSVGQTPTPSLDLLQVLPASKRVEVGEQFQLGAQRVLGKSAENVTAQATLRSDDESIVSVSNDGDQGAVAKAVRAGTAHIIAEYAGMSGMAEVIVSAAVGALQLEPAVLVVPLGASQALGAVMIAGDEKRPLDSGSWGSADATIASVDDKGLLSALSAGETTITLTRAGLTAGTRVRVAALTLAEVQLSASFGTQVLAAGSGKLRAQATFSEDVSADITSLFAFAVSGDMPAITVEGAKVTAGSAAGTATITATGKPGSLVADMQLALQVEVVAAERLQTLTIELPEQVALDMQAIEYRVLGDYATGMLLETKPAKFAGEPAAALSIDLQGQKISPLMAASVLLTATSSVVDPSGMAEPREVKAEKLLTVVAEPLSGLVLAAAADVVQQPGQSWQLTATAQHGALSEDVTEPALWSSDDPSIAVVSNVRSGRVTAIQPGTTTLRATYRGQTASLLVTVNAP